MKLTAFHFALSFALITAVGCGTGSSQGSARAPSAEGMKYVLAEEPNGAIGVIEARKSAENGGDVVVVGRIGGTNNPWIEGRAAFMLLDPSKVVVAEGQDSAEQELCMDDCCASERADCTILVKVVDADGSVVAIDARHLLGLAVNDLVVVRGKAQKDESHNITILANAVHIHR